MFKIKSLFGNKWNRLQPLSVIEMIQFWISPGIFPFNGLLYLCFNTSCWRLDIDFGLNCGNNASKAAALDVFMDLSRLTLADNHKGITGFTKSIPDAGYSILRGARVWYIYIYIYIYILKFGIKASYFILVEVTDVANASNLRKLASDRLGHIYRMDIHFIQKVFTVVSDSAEVTAKNANSSINFRIA